MGDDEAPDWRQIRTSRHTSRKPWVCAACSEGNAAGTVYERHVYLEDGEFRVDKQHPHGCPKIMARMAEGYPPEWAAGIDVIEVPAAPLPKED